MCMIDSAEYWETVQPPHTVKARREHKCGECQRVIDKGEQHETGTFHDDHGLTTVKTCLHCVAVRSWLLVQCDGWCYEGVLVDLEEHWAEDTLLHGRYLALAISGMRRRWVKKDGTRMRVMGVYRDREPARV